MNPLIFFNRWFDVRPGEMRPLLVSFWGAFFILGFMILARSLREALYLSSFEVKTLPYITVAVTLLGLPTISLFTRMLSRYRSMRVFQGVLITVALGLGVLWPIAARFRFAVVLFYLWTALGTLLLTSGFWIVVSEHFPLRGAKRLFGLISAGGTAGAMLIGTSLSGLATAYGVVELTPLLIGFLGINLALCFFLPEPLKGEEAKEAGTSEPAAGLGEQLRQVWGHGHLRSIALIVGSATLASTLLDFQFKDMVRGTLTNKAALAGFFGAFYGWTGAVSLGIQLFLTSRILSKFGIGWALAVLPLILFLGSMSFIIIPSLALATGLRGADNSLRKSLHRSAIEVLYVPIPSWLRRKTKTFIDSVVDSVAEGLGATLVFLLVTVGNLPSRFLSAAIAVIALVFLFQARKMNREYYRTLVGRLKEGNRQMQMMPEQDEHRMGRDLWIASFADMDLKSSLQERGIVFHEQAPPSPADIVQAPDLAKILASEDSGEIARVLRENTQWETDQIPALIRLLARDSFVRPAADALVQAGPVALPFLTTTLADEEADFVIRRRIPRTLSRIKGESVAPALLQGLMANRFEIRYRSAIALTKLRKDEGMEKSPPSWHQPILEALRFEVNRQKAVWEAQLIFDQLEEDEKEGVLDKRVEARGDLSLVHAFRLLSLVWEPVSVKTAYQGLLFGDEKLKSFALEYLEHILPPDIREKLWPFIGDISERQRLKAQRPVEEVVEDLLKTGATLFEDDTSKETLRNALNALRK